MAFPQTPLPVVVEMFTDQWVDITDDAQPRGNGIAIARGLPDEASDPEPGSCALSIRNVKYEADGVTVDWAGRYSPRNPNSIYYGLIGRNTPIRVSIGDDLCGVPHLRIDSTSAAAQVTTSDDAVLDITGDIDIRIDAALDSWETGSTLAGKYDTSGDNRSWAFVVDASGNLALRWSTDGTSGTELTATSTVAAGVTNRVRKALRVTLDVDNGSGGHTVTFYTADTIDGSWVQLGATTSGGAGTTSIYASVVQLAVGWVIDLGTSLKPSGKVYGFELRDGIGGTEVANPDFAIQEPGGFGEVTFFTDDAGREWVLPSSLYIKDPGIRTVDEISELPSRWDLSGRDAWVPVTAQGVLRRLSQGSRPGRSPMTSTILAFGLGPGTSVGGYWAMEETGGSSFASAISAGPRLIYSGTPEFAATGAFLGSDALPVLGVTTSLTGSVTRTLVDGAFEVGCLMDVPAVTGWANNTPILRVTQEMIDSTVATWEVRYISGAGGDLQVRALDASGTQLAAGSTVDLNIDGKQFWLGLVVDGLFAAEWSLFIRTVDEDGVTVSETGSYNQAFAGPLVVRYPTAIQVAPSAGLTGLGIGQLLVAGTSSAPDAAAGTGTGSALVGRAGETAGDRATRLCEDLGVTLFPVGDIDETAAMGAQATPSVALDALNETWQADQGLLFETRDELGLTFRVHDSLCDQVIALTLDYDGAGEIAPDLQPTDDDRFLRNDVTVNRVDGSSARFADSTSRIGTQSPPEGVGPYKTTINVNLADDDVLIHHAGWRVRLGTWDEARYPQVTIDMAALAQNGKTDLIADVAALDVGDRIQLTNLPVWAAAENVDLIVLGYEEHLDQFTWTITLNTRPYGPYRVGILADTSGDTDPLLGRLSGDAECALRVDVDDNDTSFAFDPNHYRCTTDADDFDPDLRVNLVKVSGIAGGGETVEVSSIATTAATFVAVGTADHDDNAAVTPGDYAGGAADDWVVVIAGSRDTTSPTLAVTDPNYTYTEIGNQGGLYVWAAVRTADTPAPTVSPTSGAAGDTVSAQVFGLRGMPVTLALDRYVLEHQGLTNSSAQNIAHNGLVPGIYAGRVILILARKSDDWTSVAVPSGFTEITETSSTSGNDQALYAAYRIDTTPAVVASGSLAVTGGAGAVSDSLVLAIVGGFQTMTVSARSVNGVVKSHDAGTRLEVSDPLVLAL